MKMSFNNNNNNGNHLNKMMNKSDEQNHFTLKNPPNSHHHHQHNHNNQHHYHHQHHPHQLNTHQHFHQAKPLQPPLNPQRITTQTYEELIANYLKQSSVEKPRLRPQNIHPNPHLHQHIQNQHQPPTNHANFSPQSNYSPFNNFNNATIMDKLSLCVRFAVNGLSKFNSAGSGVPTNRNIQESDFGDDAGMIAENQKAIVIGLADGAGGNRANGIDPRIFSRSLLGFCVEYVRNEAILPNELPKLTCKAVQSLESKNIMGSGTLCLLSIDKSNNVMHSLNMGDSGFTLLRNGQVTHKSNATMAGSSPKQLYVTSSNYSGISFFNEEDIIRDSDVNQFRVEIGDIIVLASDGMYDVVTDEMIEKVVNSHDPKNLQGISDDLLMLSMRSYVQTQRDDILVMVCRVEPKI